MHRIIFLLIGLSVVLTACRKGFEGTSKDDQPPKTYLVVDTIIRSGLHRLTAQVSISWRGADADGYIKGYEWSLDRSTWHYTIHTDTTFIFNTPFGSDTGNIRFFIRAIDNLGLRDPSPAHVLIPIKNSPPTIAYISGPSNPVRTLPIVRFFFNATDPDGASNLNHIEMAWNDSLSKSYFVRPTSTSVLLEATDMTASVSSCKVYLNNNTFSDSGTLSGMKLNADNTLYIRAVDNAGKSSKWVSSYTIYIKKPQSKVVFINGYGYTGTMSTDVANTQGFYLNHIYKQLAYYPDTIQLYEANAISGPTQLAPDLFTQSKIFALYQTIVWAAGDEAQSLSLGERTLTTFFNNGGKLLFAGYISSSFDNQATYLDFTPASALYVPKDTTLILTDSSHLPPLVSGYPVLKSNQFLTTVRPFTLNYGSTPLYSANLLARQISTGNYYNWKAGYPLIAKKTDGSGNTNFVFSALELQNLDANSNMDAFFKQVLHTEFGL